MLSFTGRTAIVTGAGRGLGRAHAMLLAARGANVVVNDLGGAPDGTGGDVTPAKEVVREIVGAGGSAVADASTVATTEGAESIVGTALEHFGGVDVVVNNAGILTAHQVPSSGVDDLELNLRVHLLGSFNVTRAAWPHMQEKGYGRVVMTTSCAAAFGSPFLTSYGAAKGGIIGMARNLATSGAPDGITVNMVAPYALTRMADPDLPVNRLARAEVADSDDTGVFQRLLPEYVSAVVAFLAHESCPVTGEIYSAGGGLVARMFIAETLGYASSTLSPEDVAGNWDTINAEEGYLVPTDIADYTTHFVQRVP